MSKSFYNRKKETGRQTIDRIRGEIIDEQLRTGRHYVVTARGVPADCVTIETVKQIAEYIDSVIKTPNNWQRATYNDWQYLEVTDTFTGKKTPLKEYLRK